MNITTRQLEIMQHTCGLNKYGKCSANNDSMVCRDHSSDTLPGHRNRFCAGVDDEPDCRELVDLGLMAEHARTEWLPYFNCSVTDAGRKAIRELSPAPPKRTRSQKRYDAFLDADTGYSFGEWLKR